MPEYTFDDYIVFLTNHGNGTLFLKVTNRITYMTYETTIDRIILNRIRYVPDVDSLYRLLNDGFVKTNSKISVKFCLKDNDLILSERVHTGFFDFEFEIFLPSKNDDEKDVDSSRINRMEIIIKE